MPDNQSFLSGRELNNTADNIRAADLSGSLLTDVAREEVIRAAELHHTPVPSRELCEEVRKAVMQAAKRDAASMDALQNTVCQFTVAMRGQGATPEGTLIALKTLLGVGREPLISHTLTDWTGYILREQMSTWCIKEYFKDAGND